MTTLSINTIYRATEGEGIHLGHPQVFIRFQGCSIGCVNCDSKETWDFNPNNHRSLTSVLSEVEKYLPLKRISITGGDPLHPTHVPSLLVLINELKQRGYWINLEAAGTRVLDDVFNLCDFISFDFKTPSTGVRNHLPLLKSFIEKYSHKAQIKSVIADHIDFQATLSAQREVSPELSIPWILTPCFNTGEALPFSRFQEVVRFNEESGSPFRVIIQQHKYLYGSDMRNV